MPSVMNSLQDSKDVLSCKEFSELYNIAQIMNGDWFRNSDSFLLSACLHRKKKVTDRMSYMAYYIDHIIKMSRIATFFCWNVAIRDVTFGKKYVKIIRKNILR